MVGCVLEPAKVVCDGEEDLRAVSKRGRGEVGVSGKREKGEDR